MKKIRGAALVTVSAATAVLAAVLVPVSAQALGQYSTGAMGIDLSYPSCGKTVPSGEPFGIVGVSGGRVYTDNSCAAAEAHNFSNASIYVNTGLDTSSSYFTAAMNEHCTPGDTSCGAYWYGYAAGIHAYHYAALQGLASAPTWWLDVETTNTWTNNTALNMQSIWGEHQAIAAMTPATTTTPRAEIGVYARPGQATTITGTQLSAHQWPAWYATGLRNQTTAGLTQYCSESFTASPVYIVQWIGSGRLNDQDYAC